MIRYIIYKTETGDIRAILTGDGHEGEYEDAFSLVREDEYMILYEGEDFISIRLHRVDLDADPVTVVLK